MESTNTCICNYQGFTLPDRQPILNELTTLFGPVGPTEQILIRDIADYRMQLKDADQRRQAVLDALGDEAVRLYHSRLQEEFAQLQSYWTFEPDRFDKSMRQSMLGLEFYISNLQQLKLQLNEARIDADENQFLTFLRQFIGKIYPMQMGESSLKLLYAYIKLVDQAAIKPLINAWNHYFKRGSSNPALDWYLSTEPQCPRPEEALKLLHETVDRLLQTYQASYEILLHRHNEECRRFAYGYRANREFNESLRQIFADRRTIQQRHDQALRYLTQVQERRRRDAAKAAERVARQAEKSTHRSPRQSLAEVQFDYNLDADNHSAEMQQAEKTTHFRPIIEIPDTEEHQEIVSLIEMEISLSEGDLQEIPAESAKAIFQFWPDEELDCNSRRFQKVFGQLSNHLLLHEIKEIAAAEKSRRHDINKLLEAA